MADRKTLEGAADSRSRGRSRTFHLASAIALVVVAAVALAIGSGVGRTAPPTLAQRAASLESEIKCPQCEDLSVAQSNASSAIAVRHQIDQMLVAGATDAEIKQSLVARYTLSILLVPPASGLGALVWFLPLVAVVLALGALGVLFWRRQRALVRLRAGPP
ncbi:MAG TPA: cytochrome c-type biogenesis protein CcmH [Acidimicrobiales bacterium]|nr:cytochrome c-type biogenesis protein CcmH [Acidimicrobiales bacterium]